MPGSVSKASFAEGLADLQVAELVPTPRIFHGMYFVPEHQQLVEGSFYHKQTAQASEVSLFILTIFQP